MKLNIQKQNTPTTQVKPVRTRKTVIISLAALIGLTTGLVLINEFYNNYMVSYQTPIIIQSPIVITKREPVIIYKEVIIEATPSPTPVSKPVKQSFAITPSSRLQAHINAKPQVWEKIKAHFQDDAVVVGELLSRESSLEPTAINRTSKACGLGQALPCSKMPCDLTEEATDCQLSWVKDYITTRYGTPAKALAFHNQKGWY